MIARSLLDIDAETTSVEEVGVGGAQPLREDEAGEGDAEGCCRVDLPGHEGVCVILLFF